MDNDLKEWLNLLQSNEVSDRLVAVKSLQHLGEEEALEPLILALKDESFLVQKITVTALWELANPKVVPHLIPLLGSSDAEVREEARSALSELIVSDDLFLLLEALFQENIHLQLNILFLLRKIHDVQALPAILPFLQSPNSDLREAAIVTLRYLNQVERCEPALVLLTDPEASVRRATALTLGHLQDETVISKLSQALLTDSDWEVRRNAAKALAIHANALAIETLEKALKDEHWQVRRFSIQALQKIPSHGLLLPLIKALTDEFSDVRKDAAIALGLLKNSQALPALEQTLNDPDRDVVIYAQRAIQTIQSTLQEHA